MLYSLEQGPVEEKILEQAARSGMPIPPKMANAPVLRLGLQLYYIAFQDLSSDRHLGMDEGMIPWSSVESYAVALGLDEETKEDLHSHIIAMDVARTNHYNSKR